MKAYIKAVEYVFPATVLDNEHLATLFPDWSAEKIAAKTGVRRRHVVAPEECASDLAVAASRKLLDLHGIPKEEIDYIILCTQSPDYFLPTTACLVQDRLGLSKSCGALDINLGCSGFVYGLGLAKGLIETAQANRILLITAETYSKHIHPGDKSVRTIFGDAAAATLIVGESTEEDGIGPFVYGTDGGGACNLIVPTGGMRKPRNGDASLLTDESGNTRTENDLFMNGPEIFSFTLKVIPPLVKQLLERANLQREEVDLWVFHQANQFMLDHLRKKLGMAVDRFALAFDHCGNTVSSTIPIALNEMQAQGKIKHGHRLALVGFGVGYSWAGTMIRWS